MKKRVARLSLFIACSTMAGCGDSSDSGGQHGSTNTDGGTNTDSGANADGSANTDGDTNPDANENPSVRNNEPPWARGETFYVLKGQSLEIQTSALLVNDTDPDGDVLSLRVIGPPTKGSLTPTATGFIYAPSKEALGEDRFTYEVADKVGATDTTEATIHVANTIYYVSNHGDDSAPGTSPEHPWKSPNVWATNRVKPGDVVLLERGSVFRETLSFDLSSSNTASRVLGAYGNGPDPIVSGSEPVKEWTEVGKGVWRAPFPERPAHLYVNKTWQTPARTPNSGSYYWSGASPDPGSGGHITTLNLPDLNQPKDAHVGATLRMRTRNWAFTHRRIVASSPGSVTVDTDQHFKGFEAAVHEGGFAYYVDGKRDYLDAPGEWAYDDTEKMLYYFPLDANHKPSSELVEAVIREKGIDISNGMGRDTTVYVDGLRVEQTKDVAVAFWSPSQGNAVLRRVDLRASHKGVTVWMDNVRIIESTILDMIDEGGRFGEAGGDSGVGVGKSELLRSTVANIGLIPGYGTSGWGCQGIVAKSPGFVARHNIFRDIGYTAMEVGTDALIEENLVIHALSSLNDGGSIAFSNTDGLSIRNNIVVDAMGSFKDSVDENSNPFVIPYKRLAMGIYFGDKGVKNVLVEGNVVIGHSMGIFIDHTGQSEGNTVRANLSYGNEDVQIANSDQSLFHGPQAGPCVPSYHDNLLDNWMIPSTRGQWLYTEMNTKCSPPVNWGTIGNNHYALLYHSQVHVMNRDSLANEADRKNYSFEDWKNTQEPTATRTPETVDLEDGESPSILYNAARGPRIVDLTGKWQNLEGEPITKPVVIGPYSAVVLIPRH